MVGGTSKRWLLRFHGGPMRIIQSGKPLNETRAKAAYMEKQCWTGTDQVAPDDAWVKCEQIPDEEIGKYTALLTPHPAVGKPLALIEV